MTGRTGQLAAVDLGATSGRVMLATVRPPPESSTHCRRYT